MGHKVNYAHENLSNILATAKEILAASGRQDSVGVLSNCKPTIRRTGHDNYDGGKTIHTIYLHIPPRTFATLTNKNEVETEILDCIKSILSQYRDDWFLVEILPEIQRGETEGLSGEPITSEIRQNIIDGLKIDGVSWCGQLDDIEFLSRIFDLNALPSTDNRFDDAAGDIWQHTVNNDDWEIDWIYTDPRFNLLGCTNSVFLQFLAETVHPVVRPDRAAAETLVRHYNEQLKHAGWRLIGCERIAGRPKYVAQLIGRNGTAFARAKSVADVLDAGWMHQQIDRIENTIETDPSLAIGTAKELVETCYKTILQQCGIEFPKGADILKLARLVNQELKLMPENIAAEKKGAETIRVILQQLASLTQKIAELRSLYGSGHGPDGNFRGLEPRHARLAASTAIAVIEFVTATHKRKRPK